MEPYRFSVPLAPILVIQGKLARSKTPRLPEAAGDRCGTHGSGKLLRLLIAGDSAAAGVGTDTQDSALSGYLCKRFTHHFKLDWQLEAKTGNTTFDTLQHLQALAAKEFDLVVVSTGVNDVTGGIPIKTWTQQLDELYGLFIEKFSAKRIIFSGIPPMGEFPALPQPLRYFMGKRAALFDQQLLTKVAAMQRGEYIGFADSFDSRAIAEDGFHPNAYAYQRWADLIGDKVIGC